MPVHTRCCFVLPTASLTPGSRSSNSTFSANARHEGGSNPNGTYERPHGRSSSSQRRGVWGAFQVHDESDGHIAMSGEDHRQTICPAGLEGRPAQPTCASQSRPPKTRGMPAALRMCASCTTSMRMMRQRTATSHHRGLPHNSPLTVARQPTGDNLLSPKRCEPAMTTLTANPALQESAPGTSVALTTYSANGPRRKTDVPTECPRLSCPVDLREDPCRLILSTPVQRSVATAIRFNTSQAVGLTPSLFHTCVLPVCTRIRQCAHKCCCIEAYTAPILSGGTKNARLATLTELPQEPCVGPKRTTRASTHLPVLRLPPA